MKSTEILGTLQEVFFKKLEEEKLDYVDKYTIKSLFMDSVIELLGKLIDSQGSEGSKSS